MSRTAFVLPLLLLPAVALGGARASSFKRETRLGENHWNAVAAIDGNMETCWMVDPEQENVGQWMEIDLPSSTVDKIAFVTGWAKSDTTFADYARIQTANVQLYNGEGALVLEQAVNLEDRTGWQVIDLPDTPVLSDFGGGKARINIAAVYDGQDYPNLGVSEVRVYLKPELVAPIAETPAPALANHPFDHCIDDNPRTYWQSADTGVGSTFTIGAEGWSLAGLEITPGPRGYSRMKTVEIVVNDRTSRVELPQEGDTQFIEFPSLLGYTGSAWGNVQVTVIDVWPGDRGALAVTEMKLHGTAYEGL